MKRVGETQVSQGTVRMIRIGGLVEEGTIKRESDGLTVKFTVTDTAHSIPVVYKGILPDLFKEGHDILGARICYRAPGDQAWQTTEEFLASLDENLASRHG